MLPCPYCFLEDNPKTRVATIFGDNPEIIVVYEVFCLLCEGKHRIER